MRIHTLIEIDVDGCVIREEGYEYTGPVAECKRDKVKGQATQQMNMMQNFMQQAFGLQQGMVSPLTQFLQQMVQQPSGFPPEMLAAMRGNVIDTTSNQFNNALGSVKTNLARRGFDTGEMAAGGLAGQGFGALEAQRAMSTSSGLRDVDIQNALAALQNRWHAANQLGSYASIFSPSPFAAGASSSLGSLTDLWTRPSIFQSTLPALVGKVGFGKGTPLGFNTGG